MYTAATLLVAATSVSAFRGCGGHEIGARNIGMGNAHFARDYDPNTLDVTAQCAPYNYPPAASIAANFPTNWGAATIPASDTVAQGLFAQLNKTIQEKVGNVAVKVGTQGDFTGYNYDNTADPDCWWSKTKCTEPKADLNIASDISRLPEPNSWGYGFDDGPNCSHNALYNFLNEQKQKATMFFIGSNVMNWPRQALRAHEDGHEICVHTWSHPAMTTMSNEGAFAELYYTREALKAITGVTPKCWRPPYGDVDNRIRVIAQFLNLTNVLWSDDTFDWQEGTGGVTSETITQNYQKVFDKAKAGEYNTYGAIVLNHEANNKTMQHMIDQYPNIKANFKYIVPIASAMNWTSPYAEANETYPDFNAYTSGQLTGGPAPSDGSTGNSPGASTKSGGASGSAAGASGAAASNAAASGKPSAASPRATAAGVLAVVGVAAAMLI